MSRGRIPPPAPTSTGRLTPISNTMTTKVDDNDNVCIDISNKGIYEKLSTKFEDAIVSILTLVVYIVVMVLILIIGIVELGKLAYRAYPNIKNWIAEKLSHMC